MPTHALVGTLLWPACIKGPSRGGGAAMALLARLRPLGPTKGCCS